jgi:hypothetical protein
MKNLRPSRHIPPASTSRTTGSLRMAPSLSAVSVSLRWAEMVPLADESGSDGGIEEPHEATPLYEPEAPLEAISIPADADTNVSESRVQIESWAPARTRQGPTPSRPAELEVPVVPW